MRLHEHEGKSILERYGISVPTGGLWPSFIPSEFPVVVKAQILAGKRKRHGAIRLARNLAECRTAVEDLLRAEVSSERVEQVYIENLLDAEEELYLALTIDHELCMPLLLASRSGGVGIEEAHDSSITKLTLDPLIGIQEFVVRTVIDELGLPGTVSSEISQIIHALYDAFFAEEAVLIEINPLILTRDQRLIAADAKVVLDENAHCRHATWDHTRAGGTAFESNCGRWGANAVEMHGRIALVVSGAGLMMATVDTINSLRGSVRAAVDLGGAVFTNENNMVSIFREVLSLNPHLIMVNACMQLSSCEFLAQGISFALQDGMFHGTLVIRFIGRGSTEAKGVLAPFPHIFWVDDLFEACELAVSHQALV